MDIERQQVYNINIDSRKLSKENQHVINDSLQGNTHSFQTENAFHTESYRSHAMSSKSGEENLGYTHEIIEFNFDEEIKIYEYINFYKN